MKHAARKMKLSEWRAASALPSHETDLLIEHVCGLDRLHIMLDAPLRLLSFEEESELNTLHTRRANGEPLQYLLGYAYFMGYRFVVTPEVLIPRPDTEILVAEAVNCLRSCGTRHPRVLDLCTGSGCVGISILKESGTFSAPQMTLSDISEGALAAAKSNAQALLGEGSQIQFRQSDFFKALGPAQFDLIVSNPPYIPGKVVDTLDPEVRKYEPRLALDGGADGLDAYREIALHAPDLLAEKGHLLLEIGYDQADTVPQLFSARFSHVKLVPDLNGIRRVVHLYN